MSLRKASLILFSAITLLGCGARQPTSVPSDAHASVRRAEGAADAGTSDPPAAPSTDGRATAKAGAGFRSDALGISFHPGVCSTNEGSGYVDLDGDFWVDEPHGLVEPGQDPKQYFRGRIAIAAK